MKRDLFNRWLDALESEKYRQGQVNLKKRNGRDICYCCLGVLLEVAGVRSWEDGTTGLFYFEGASCTSAGGASSFLPYEFSEKHGIKDNGNPSHRDARALTSMNDGCTSEGVVYQPVPFPEIAAHLRAHPDWYLTLED